MRITISTFLILTITLLTACGPTLPESADNNGRQANVKPEYDGAVLPPNVAPTNFMISEDGDEYVVHIFSKNSDEEIILGGNVVDIPLDEWRSLLTETKGDTVYTDVYVKKEGKWEKFNTIKNRIAEEDVDNYITYRLIEPSYEYYTTLTLNERNITNFDERIVYSNDMINSPGKMQCVNCHIPRNHNKDNQSNFHVRQTKGGTVIIQGDDVRKVNLKTDATLSAGVYASWHPEQNLIAYSVNKTGQMFHTRDVQKIEVLDFASDLILYDVEGNKVYSIDKEEDEFETFPSWSPDGKTLYYASAHFEQKTNSVERELTPQYQSLKYNIYSRPFDSSTRTFGPKEEVLRVDTLGKSAAFPRVSPDGRYLLYSMADYGQFHVWHKSSDLYVKDLQTNEVRALDAANTKSTESYHTWSSNGRWIMFTSRRDDENYTRLYISYFDKNGMAHKPFALPQRNPMHDTELLKSYNVPEWLVNPVGPSICELTDVISAEAVNAVYSGSALSE